MSHKLVLSALLTILLQFFVPVRAAIDESVEQIKELREEIQKKIKDDETNRFQAFLPNLNMAEKKHSAERMAKRLYLISQPTTAARNPDKKHDVPLLTQQFRDAHSLIACLNPARLLGWCSENQYHIVGLGVQHSFLFAGTFTGCYEDFIQSAIKEVDDIRYSCGPFWHRRYGFNRQRLPHRRLCWVGERLSTCPDDRIEFKDDIISEQTAIDVPARAYEKIELDLDESFECFYGDARSFGFDSNDLSFITKGEGSDYFPTAICVFQYDRLREGESNPFGSAGSRLFKFGHAANDLMKSPYMIRKICEKANELDGISLGECGYYYTDSSYYIYKFLGE